MQFTRIPLFADFIGSLVVSGSVFVLLIHYVYSICGLRVICFNIL